MRGFARSGTSRATWGLHLCRVGRLGPPIVASFRFNAVPGLAFPKASDGKRPALARRR